jgi:hypothetical protein
VFEPQPTTAIAMHSRRSISMSAIDRAIVFARIVETNRRARALWGAW